MDALIVLAPILWVAVLIGSVAWLRRRPLFPRADRD